MCKYSAKAMGPRVRTETIKDSTGKVIFPAAGLRQCGCHRMVFGMAQTDMHRGDPLLRGKALARAGEPQGRASGCVPDYFHIQPADIAPDSRAKGLGHRLLRGEPRRIMDRRTRHGITVFTFGTGEKLGQKRLAMTQHRMVDALAFHDVDAGSVNCHRSEEHT